MKIARNLSMFTLSGLFATFATAGCATSTDMEADDESENLGTAVSALCTGAPACGSVMTSIDGIPAYSNGSNQCATSSCDGTIYGTYGIHWQCVELAQRYFSQRFGTPTHWGVGYAGQMCSIHPGGTTVYSTSYTPAHGDLMVLSGNPGHVAVVDSVSGTTINVVEQNASSTGRRALSKSSAGCFVHANANGGSGGGASCSGLVSGYYCGNDGVNGNAGTLYHCSGGAIVGSQVCAGGCQVAPAGTNDYCASGGASCSGLVSGYYCGNDGVNGNASTLYHCSGGVVAGSQVCAGGCQVAPAGTNDYCK